MATIVTRETGGTAKGGPLTNAEVDTNFINLNTDKLEQSDLANYAVLNTAVTFTDLNVDSIQLSGAAADEGVISWNADEITADLTQGGVTLQLGQEVHYLVRNSSASTIPNGTPVMISGTIGNSGRITVVPMDGTDPLNAKDFVGIATQDIASGADGKITQLGKVRGLNTSTFVEGARLWISTTVVGGLTATEPPTGLRLSPAVVVTSSTNGAILVRPQLTNRIRDLSDVAFTVDPVDNDFLIYSSGAWRPATPTFSQIGSTPTTLAGYGITDAATSAQGALAETAVQPAANISVLTNDAGYITEGVPVGGAVDQVLAKASATDYDVTWLDMSGGMKYVLKTTTYTAQHNDGVLADTSGGVWTLTLPATPEIGARVGVTDVGDWAVNNLTVARNGSTIGGVAQDLIMDVAGASVELLYDGTTWLVTIAANVRTSGELISTTSVQTFSNKTWTAPKETVANVSSVGGVLTIDLNAASLFKCVLTENITSIVFQNLPPAGVSLSPTLKFVQGATPRTVTWPASFIWNENTPVPVGDVNGGINTFLISTSDSGVVWEAYAAGVNMV